MIGHSGLLIHPKGKLAEVAYVGVQATVRPQLLKAGEERGARAHCSGMHRRLGTLTCMEGLNLLSLLGLLALIALLTLLIVIGVWLLLRQRQARSNKQITMLTEQEPAGGPDPWIESGRRYGDDDCVTPSNRA